MPNCVARVWRMAEIGANLGYGTSKTRDKDDARSYQSCWIVMKIINFDNLGEIAL